VLDETGFKIEPDLTRPDLRRLFDSHPEQFVGFNESDPPNNSFDSDSCSFSGATRTLAEQALQNQENGFVWRFGQPFNQEEHPANLLSKLHGCAEIHDSISSLSHIEDCVGACLELWERRSPFGVYNVVNPGAIATRDLLQMIWRVLGPRHGFEPRLQPNGAAGSNGSSGSNGEPEPDCILDGSKLARAGVKLSPVREAVERALEKWKAREEIAGAVRTAE
jgi:nucleoside-diphosphate-sugar epimerase